TLEVTCRKKPSKHPILRREPVAFEAAQRPGQPLDLERLRLGELVGHFLHVFEFAAEDQHSPPGVLVYQRQFCEPVCQLLFVLDGVEEQLLDCSCPPLDHFVRSISLAQYKRFCSSSRSRCQFHHSEGSKLSTSLLFPFDRFKECLKCRLQVRF